MRKALNLIVLAVHCSLSGSSYLFSYFVQPEFNQFFLCGNTIAVPVAITVTMLAKGEIKTKGVIPPEGLEPKPFLAKLSEKGCAFEERITKEIRP